MAERGADQPVAVPGEFAIDEGRGDARIETLAREQTGPVSLKLTAPNGNTRVLEIPITPRTFPLERVNGVPEETVNPRPEIAERIKRAP